MIKAIEFPNKVFSSKQELFLELKKNESKLIGLKKAQSYKSCEKGQVSFLDGIKAIDSIEIKGFRVKENCIYPIISTTNYRDSHKDVHFSPCFNKTIKDQQGRVYYALDHELKWDSILAWPKDVRMFKSDIPWSMVGKNYDGTTEALVFEIEKDKITRKDVLLAIENKVADFENSIRMIYYKITLGIDSKSFEFKDNKEYFDSRIDEIANKEEVLEDGYFWGVEELGIHKEGSLVVAGGSNDATSIYSKLDAVEDTSNEESAAATQKEELEKFYLNIKV